MKIDSIQLINELTEMTNSHLEFVNSLKTNSKEQLNWKLNQESWSPLECLQHLNLTLNFYIPEIKKRIESSSIPSSNSFKGSYLGNRFASSMLPKEKMKKVNTFKKVNPINSELNKENVIGTFIHHQKQLLELLNKAKDKNLTKIKTSTLLPLLKLRLGNTLQLVTYHNERHIMQAKKALFSQKIK